MITVEEAKRMGIEACVNEIGRDLVLANQDKATMACGVIENSVYCFVGVDMEERREKSGDLILDSISKFTYQASCKVSLTDGDIMFECV